MTHHFKITADSTPNECGSISVTLDETAMRIMALTEHTAGPALLAMLDRAGNSPHRFEVKEHTQIGRNEA